MSYLEKYFAKVSKEKQKKATIAYLAALDHIAETTPKVQDAIVQELRDQRAFLKLIASENYSSLAVQLAQGNLLTDKYAEGYVGHRFYAGCENVDAIEEMGVQEVKKLFNAEHAYIQPHSGADANLVAYWSILIRNVQTKEVEKIGKKDLLELSDAEYEKVREVLCKQKILGMGLGSGGHLTHGYRHNISSKMMQAVSYDVDETGLINYAKIQEIAKKEKPLILLAGYSAYPRLIDFSKMKEIADSVGAVLMVDMAHFAGLVAGKVMKGVHNPIPYADVVTSTTHKTLRGPRGGLVLCKESYKEIVNKGCPSVLGGPLPHVMAAKAIAFKEANEPSFATYAEQIVKNAKALAEEFLSLGVDVLTQGTDNHMVLINVQKSFGINGRQAETLLRKASFTVNRNSIPKDPNGAWYTSGVRLGTPALTTLGMKEEEMKLIARWITEIGKNARAVEGKSQAVVEEKIVDKIKGSIKELLQRFPLYPEIVID